jgi:hypothetical protein
LIQFNWQILKKGRIREAPFWEAAVQAWSSKPAPRQFISENKLTVGKADPTLPDTEISNCGKTRRREACMACRIDADGPGRAGASETGETMRIIDVAIGPTAQERTIGQTSQAAETSLYSDVRRNFPWIS